MTWLVWRQHRHQASLAAAALAAFAVLLLVTGRQMASQYQAARAACAPIHTCGNLANSLSLGSPVLFLLVTLTLLVPCLLGVFWGGPLVARELETGTSQFAWTQSITRRRWLTAKVGWALLAAAAWGGAVSALVTWWSSPLNALNQQNFTPGQFDTQGIVPVGYALFAVALGIAAGALVRRTLPALAITVGVFAALRIVIAAYVRPHYMTALTILYKFGDLRPRPTGSYWVISRGLAGPGGHVLGGPAHGGPGVARQAIAINGVPISNMPSACRALVFQSPLKTMSCLTAHGYRASITYQPASRYWAFQGIETGIFVALGAVLIAVTVLVVLRRDA
jgi:ABC-type transport system involved in multi-copper enzyme maturation permease subunit